MHVEEESLEWAGMGRPPLKEGAWGMLAGWAVWKVEELSRGQGNKVGRGGLLLGAGALNAPSWKGGCRQGKGGQVRGSSSLWEVSNH